MRLYIVMPAHNEAAYISKCLDSLITQTLLPKKLIVVNDNSTDTTEAILQNYVKQHHWIECITISSSKRHIPGGKVINAFNKGLQRLDEEYDVICKFDADIEFPKHYLEAISTLFQRDEAIGIAGGLPYIKRNNEWVFEKIASKNHVRGPIKAYKKACFKAIGGLRESVGWDTVDVLLAQFYGWKVQTDKKLHVRHLKPTGNTYATHTNHLQGEALYRIRSGWMLLFLSALKSGFNKKSGGYFVNTVYGYAKAARLKSTPLVTKEQGRFIRKLRWKNIFKKLRSLDLP